MKSKKPKYPAKQSPSKPVRDQQNAYLDLEGLHFATPALIAANAHAVDWRDPFVPSVVRLLARVAAVLPELSHYDVVRWPDGLIGTVRKGLSGSARTRELVRCYRSAFNDLLDGLGQSSSLQETSDE